MLPCYNVPENILNKDSDLKCLYGTNAIQQNEYGHSLNENAQSTAKVRKQLFLCHSTDYLNVHAACPKQDKNSREKFHQQYNKLYRCYDKFYSCMIGSWFPGVENECKMNSSPHAAYR
jgi:hypothetical protein